MAGWVDLDALQRKLDADLTLDDWPDYEAVKRTVAELRAAREVVEAVRDWWVTANDEDALQAEGVIRRALAAYDRAAQPDRQQQPGER